METLLEFNNKLVFIIPDTQYCRLRLDGDDCVDLLNRLSASELKLDNPEDFSHGLLTDERGRMLGVFTVVKRATNDLLMVCYTPDYSAITEHIEKYTIVEDVTFSQISKEIMQFSVAGEMPSMLANELRQALCVVLPSAFASKLLTEVLVQSSNYDNALEIMKKHNFSVGNEHELEQIRISYGWPAAGRELTSMVNPLEAGLKHLISFTKGCYIGQEVIARLDTYDKVKHRLIGFKSQNPVEVGHAVENDSGECGWVTSCIDWSDYFIGLAYVKNRMYGENKSLKIREQLIEERELTSTVIENESYH